MIVYRTIENGRRPRPPLPKGGWFCVKQNRGDTGIVLIEPAKMRFYPPVKLPNVGNLPHSICSIAPGNRLFKCRFAACPLGKGAFGLCVYISTLNSNLADKILFSGLAAKEDDLFVFGFFFQHIQRQFQPVIVKTKQSIVQHQRRIRGDLTGNR